ncbi:transglutaminase 5, like [Hypomesus transpacificus]|uniref:transglutaminase 5, like n=1 Tax=Hypomesus transpacificus TaxID=137520 RepID=UPI001F080DF2|nr:transglutaminase 5, like [Hypomesus transpacificus]
MGSHFAEKNPEDTLNLMEDLSVQYVNLEELANQQSHETQGFTSRSLVVRRGAPFRVTLDLKGRPFNPQTDTLIFKALLGRLRVSFPVTFSKEVSLSGWGACFSQEGLNPLAPSVFLSTPASAAVGQYSLQLHVLTQICQKAYMVGRLILLCNPWCREDAVYIPFEDQRNEYVKNESGLLFMGPPSNLVSRPWSFDQYEPGILEICMMILQLSPQHSRNHKQDYLSRGDPVYISRVVSAMINCEDDRGVLKGNWSGDFSQGVPPSKWTRSEDILRLWAKSGFSPVKYGQCWVYAAVMCTVMRVLGIPTRVVTNFNSAHDTNGNLVIEEFYSETGMKLPQTTESIWNFHVWVECWMTRPDLGSGLDGWQVLDPTPQERSGGVFCCGPAPIRAIRDRQVDLPYDVPFVVAEVNADVHMVVVRQGQVISRSIDTERVGSLVCTKAVGLPRPCNITANYKATKAPSSGTRSRGSSVSPRGTLSRGSTQGLSVSLALLKMPVSGESISFAVTITNMEAIPKVLKEHVNAQAKTYDHSPSDTFWESHSLIQIAPLEVKVLRHHIGASQYEGLVGEDLVNLAVVLKDQASSQTFLASEEINVPSAELSIQVSDEDSIVPHKEYQAVVAFINPFSVPVSGILTVCAAGLIEGKAHSRIHLLQPGGSVERTVSFTPRMVGVKMLQASLTLENHPAVVRGFHMVPVKAP